MVAEREFLQGFAIEAVQARFEIRSVWRTQIGPDIPVFLWLEEFDLVLAVADDAERDRLHAARRPAARQFAPKHRRQVEADEIVQGSACKVGVDQFAIDLARVLHRRGDGVLGDRVEDDAFDRCILFQGAALAQGLDEMPADGFAFAIRVGRQYKRVGFLEGGSDLGNPLGRLRIGLPDHRKIIVGIDRAILRRKVTNMPV